MPRRQAYQSQLARHAGVLEQSFRANFVVAEREELGWLIAFGDLLGDEALGNMRSPIHSLLVHIDRSAGRRSRGTLAIEFNDQWNTREEKDLERFDLGRETLRIRVRPRAALVSGRVSYERAIDPFLPDRDPTSRRIRSLHVTFSCAKRTYGTITKILAPFRGDWLRVSS